MLADYGSTMTRNLQVFLRRDNLNLVRREAESFEAIQNFCPNVIAVFSDTAGENQKVHTAEQSNVCPDRLAHGNGKDLERESGAWIFAPTLFQSLHIAFAGR